MGEPHPHNPGQEEIWAAIDGNSLAFIGSELRVQRPGMAYMIRPDHYMTHSNINSGRHPGQVPLVFRFLAQEIIRRRRNLVEMRSTGQMTSATYVN